MKFQSNEIELLTFFSFKSTKSKKYIYLTYLHTQEKKLFNCCSIHMYNQTKNNLKKLCIMQKKREMKLAGKIAVFRNMSLYLFVKTPLKSFLWCSIEFYLIFSHPNIIITEFFLFIIVITYNTKKWYTHTKAVKFIRLLRSVYD